MSKLRITDIKGKLERYHAEQQAQQDAVEDRIRAMARALLKALEATTSQSYSEAHREADQFRSALTVAEQNRAQQLAVNMNRR